MEPAQLRGVRRGGSGDQGTDQVAVGDAVPELARRVAGTLVVHTAQRLEKFRRGGLGLLVILRKLLLARREPIAGFVERTEAEQRGKPVVHAAGLGGHHLAELAVRQDGTIGAQVLFPT